MSTGGAKYVCIYQKLRNKLLHCVIKSRLKDCTALTPVYASKIVTATIINVAQRKACHLIDINPREYVGTETRFRTISIQCAEYA